MAEVLANYFSQGSIQAWSEGHGGMSSGAINPLTAKVLARAGVPASQIVRNTHARPPNFDRIVVFDDLDSTENSKRTRNKYGTAGKRYEIPDPYMNEEAYSYTYGLLRDVLQKEVGVAIPALPA